MLTLVSRFPRVVAIIMLGAMAIVAVRGQGKDRSLTKDFDKLSAKERSRIAAQENAEAGLDTMYQRLMHAGDQAFRVGEYETALEIFTQARELRPYNVYPKVKMEDLQALIKKQQAEAAAQATPEPVIEPPGSAPPEEPEPATSPDPVVAPTPPEPPATSPEPLPAVPRKTTAATPSKPKAEKVVPTAPAGAEPPLDLGERVYVEAGAVVTERVMEDDGKAVVYKRVSHPWGQVFYFRDGLSISQHRWEERFTEQGR